ncbi:hypothetical protein GLOIN_2v1700277 [Rhizophagus clarus]|uniref:Uncharacterized protein n=1 Tax=Rhizophagus clarus TaxID=94130 RepID=A0A8H3QYZ6_9GLOM|nr:hypothetical protein GLOIN_2v1700277 [Rhizophagus clarus]
MIYDIPAKWSHEILLNHLTKWGTTISMTIKRQKKYMTVHVRIALSSFTVSSFDKGLWMYLLGNTPIHWFPDSWSLKERQSHSRFHLAIYNFPDCVPPNALQIRNRYFEKLEDLKRALAEDFTIKKAPYKWSKSVSRHKQSKTVLKGQSSRANTSSSKKRPQNKNKKDNSTVTANGKKKSKASKKRKSRPSQGTNDNKQIADLLLGVLSLLMPSSKGVLPGLYLHDEDEMIQGQFRKSAKQERINCHSPQGAFYLHTYGGSSSLHPE